MKFCYEYPRPAVTVDAVVLTDESTPKVLLIRRKNPPFQNAWAFPGGFVDMDETLEEAVVRELHEETAILLPNLQQFKAYSRINRDPRFRAISVAFIGTVCEASCQLNAQDDAADARFFPITALPYLAFDHKQILEEVLLFLEK